MAERYLSPENIRTRHRQVMESAYRKYFLLNIVSGLGCTVHASFVFLFFRLDIPSLAYFSILSVAMWGLAGYLNYAGRPWASISLIAIEMVVFATLSCQIVGLDAGFQLYLWALAALLAINPSLKVGYAALSGFLSVVYLAALYLVFDHRVTDHIPDAMWLRLHTTNAIMAAVPMMIAIASVRFINERQHQEFEQLAHFDVLTGLRNRRFGITSLKYSEHRRPDGKPDCLVLGDIDHFKRTNDLYGHDVGDAVLQATAKYLSEAFRKSDQVFRWGGEEFLILLNKTNLQDAESLLHKICEHFPAEVKIPGAPDYAITMSFGLAKRHEGESTAQAMTRVDGLLYQAKERGRNRICTEDS